MTTALAYMRCSGKGQVDGDTWDRQETAIRSYAANNEIEILDWYRDEGISGKTELDNRPGLAACLERIENNGVKLLIVEDASRLARDSMVSEIIIREFQKYGGVVISASGGINLTEGDDSNPTAALIRGILALIAEFDRRVIVLKLRAARDRKKARDGRCEGIAPYGSVPAERKVLDTLLYWEKGGVSTDSMALQLNTQGIKTRHGKTWRGSVIRKILARERELQNVASQGKLSA